MLVFFTFEKGKVLTWMYNYVTFKFHHSGYCRLFASAFESNSSDRTSMSCIFHQPERIAGRDKAIYDVHTVAVAEAHPQSYKDASQRMNAEAC